MFQLVSDALRNICPGNVRRAARDRGVAYYRANDEAEDVFVAAIALVTYDSNSDVRDHFAALVAATADCYRRTYAAVAPVSRLAGLACETCEAPEAADVRFRAGQISDVSELGLSAGGFPVGCCRRQVVAVVSGSAAPRAAARR